MFFISIRALTNIVLARLIEINFSNSVVDLFPNIYYKILIVIILVPVVETFMYFYLPYVVLFFFLKNNKIILHIAFIISSSLLFSLDHKYHVSYFINSLVAGLLYSGLYLIYSRKEMNPFLCTLFLHSFYNLIVLLNN